jgi:hypothetical protein
VANVLGHERPVAGIGHAAPLRLPVLELIFDALQADAAQGSPAGSLVGDSLITALIAHLSAPAAARVEGLCAQAHDRAIDCIDARFSRCNRAFAAPVPAASARRT